MIPQKIMEISFKKVKLAAYLDTAVREHIVKAEIEREKPVQKRKKLRPDNTRGGYDRSSLVTFLSCESTKRSCILFKDLIQETIINRVKGS